MATLQNLLDIVTANSEDVIDNFLDLMRPDDFTREEMGVIYEDTVGYDPISYYDKKDMRDYADQIAENPTTPQEVVDYIKESRDELVEEAYSLLDLSRENNIQACVESVINDKFGIDLDLDDESIEDENDGDDGVDDEEFDDED